MPPPDDQEKSAITTRRSTKHILIRPFRRAKGARASGAQRTDNRAGYARGGEGHGTQTIHTLSPQQHPHPPLTFPSPAQREHCKTSAPTAGDYRIAV